jgi:hypothetical protein
MTLFNALALVFPALCGAVLALMVYLASRPAAAPARKEPDLRPVAVRAQARRRAR